MVSIAQRRLTILAWLKDKGTTEFNNHIKMQSFLFFYEVFAKVNDYTYSLDFLTSYKNTIIFQDVYNDYTYKNDEFIAAIDGIVLEEYSKDVIGVFAEVALFYVQALNEYDLPELICGYLLELEDYTIDTELTFVTISVLSEETLNRIKQLYTGHPVSLIRDCRIITIEDLNFVFISKDFNRLTEEHMATLHDLLHVESLYNPVFVSIEPDGVLLID